MGKKTMLMILDGWGLNPDPEVSAVEKAKTPFFDEMMGKYPNSQLKTHGVNVGLPEGQMGNSEVGHMNLGAGRVVYQDLLKINLAIESKDLHKNKVLLDALNYAKEEGRRVHLLGLASDGGIHSHISHMKAITEIAKDNEAKDLFIHAFTDGRDTDPKSGINFIKDLQDHLDKTVGQIATVSGRYYAMDRDTRWERIANGYHALINGEGEKAEDLAEAMKKRYENDETDEFIKPIVHTEGAEPIATIQDGDVVIFTNFRSDRARQLTEVLTQKDHPDQDMETLDLNFLAFKQYDQSHQGLKYIFEDSPTRNVIGEVLAKNNKKQLRIAETEKYAHVTYFFNNGREEPFEGEDRIVVPSPRDVSNYDEKPEMSAYEVKDKLVKYLDENEVDFVCLNFANPDMVGHTGDFDAAVKACEVVDKCAKAIVEKALEKDFTTIVIADHGNADYMKNEDGSPNTNHSTLPVPFIVISNDNIENVKEGKLGDLAPTLLSLMDIEVPEEMTGEILTEN